MSTAGIVTGPGVVPKPISMPLSEISVNRDSRWSGDSLGSMEDEVVFLGSGSTHPRRQPRNAPSEARAQSDDGFARFLKQHSSPTHRRVTAGGRIVPMEPIPAPPQFNLLINDLTRSKNSASERQTVDNLKMGNKRAAPVADGAPAVNADRLSTDLQVQNASASPRTQVNTNTGDLKSGNRMPRAPDLPYLATATSTDLPQTFGNFTSSFLNPQQLTHSQWGSLALPLPSMATNPYSNMLIPGGEQQPVMPSPMMPGYPFSSVSGADQLHFTTSRANEFDLPGLQSLPPGFLTNYNTAMSFNPSGNNQPSYAGSASMNNGVVSSGPTQGGLTGQIGTHAMAGYVAPVHTTDTHVNSMTMNHSFTQTGSAIVDKVTEEHVANAECEFKHLDSKLQNHDQYTASQHSAFTPQMKICYARQRMKIVEERAFARRKWKQLRAALDQERSAQGNLPGPTHQQQTPSKISMNSAFTQVQGNRNLNVQAAAWVPKETTQGNGIPSQPQPANQNAIHFPNGNESATSLFKTGSENVPRTTNIHLQPANSFGTKRNGDSVISNLVDTTPGPYARQLINGMDGELSDQEVDEWGVRRGFAPPQLAQKQSEEAMRIMSHLHAQGGAQGVAPIVSAPTSLQASVIDSPTTDPPYPVDEWGVRIGRAPPELARLQDEQWAKLARMHPEQRSRVSLENLDSLPSTKGNASKTVSFAENNANTTYRIPCGSDDDASSAASTDETGWRPMKSGKAPPPTQAHWNAVIEASTKEAGVKTEVPLATGVSLRVEGKGSGLAPFSSTGGAEKSDERGRHYSIMSEQDRLRITKQLMSIERGVRGLECATKKPASSGFNPWTVTDENDFFRHKGPSSVAIQSVNAQGRMPGFDAAVDHNRQKALKPFPNPGFKAIGSPSKCGSPLKRSLKDIWDAPPRRAFVGAADEEDGMSELHPVMYKY